MKSKLLKATVLATAAIAIGALASPVMAKTLTYTFGKTGGGSYCDGLTLTTTDGGIIYGGTHTGCTNNDPAGGYKVQVNGGANLDIATTDRLNNPGAGAYTFFLNLKTNSWFLYKTIGGVFQQTNGGPLIKGAPPAKALPGATPSTTPDPKRQFDRMFLD